MAEGHRVPYSVRASVKRQSAGLGWRGPWYRDPLAPSKSQSRRTCKSLERRVTFLLKIHTSQKRFEQRTEREQYLSFSTHPSYFSVAPESPAHLRRRIPIFSPPKKCIKHLLGILSECTRPRLQIKACRFCIRDPFVVLFKDII
jgi:hypothetical protein